MEENLDFFQSLESSLQNYREFLERKELKRLKEEFRFFHNSFQSFYEVLLRKGLLNKDPYKSEYKISEVTTPPTGPMKESEKKDSISQRVSHYDSILEFLNNYYQFDVENLNLSNVKQLADLVGYIKWTSFSETSSNLNTRVLAEAVKKMAPGNEDLSDRILRDSLQQLEKKSKIILSLLKKITIYQKERYKYDFRLQLFNSLHLKPEAIAQRREDVLKVIKSKFPRMMPGTPFYPELIDEVLNETAGADAEARQQEILKRLKVEEKKERNEAQQSFKPLLLEACRVLSAGATPLQQAIQKMKFNSSIIENRHYTFKERFVRWLLNMVQKEDEKRIYDIEYIDPQTAVPKTVHLNFDLFISDLQKKVQVLTAFSNKMSSTYQKLEQSSEDRIYKILSANIEELQNFLLRMPALDTYFKSETTRSQRALIKGIKLEIGAVKNAVVKANQKKHEYVSRKEEVEQLKKLGITTDA